MRFADLDLASFQSCSAYQQAVNRLAEHVTLIPEGWHPIYWKCIQSLMAIRCSSRDSIHFDEPSSEFGVLSIDCFNLSGVEVDRVVLGILRKLSKKSICTCEQCGRKAYTSKKYVADRTLCTRCFVPVAMKQEIQHWQKTLRIGKKSTSKRYDIIAIRKFSPHVRVLIPEGMVRRLESDDSSMAIEYITFADLEQLDKQLRQVEAYLDQNCL